MKTAAIIRIVVGAAAAVLLLMLLVSVLMGRTIFHNGRVDLFTKAEPAQTVPANGGSAVSAEKAGAGNGSVNSANPGNASGYSAGAASVPMSGIDKIEVEWVSGQVMLSAGSGSEIVFTETSAKPLTDRQTLRYTVRENKLIITYCENTATLWDWLDIDKLNMPSKDLTLTVPSALMDSLKEIQVDAVSASLHSDGVYARSFEAESVSGDVTIDDVTADELDVQSVSGDVEITGMSVRELDMESVSGKLGASGTVESADTQATSGNTVLTLDATPRKLDMDSVSGKIRVYLPASADDFTAKLDSVSGDLSCEFPSVMKNGRYTVGGGAREYEFETVSGDVELLKQ